MGGEAKITAYLTQHLNENSNIKTLAEYFSKGEYPDLFVCYVQKDNDFTNKKVSKSSTLQTDSFEFE